MMEYCLFCLLFHWPHNWVYSGWVVVLSTQDYQCGLDGCAIYVGLLLLKQSYWEDLQQCMSSLQYTKRTQTNQKGSFCAGQALDVLHCWYLDCW